MRQLHYLPTSTERQRILSQVAAGEPKPHQEPVQTEGEEANRKKQLSQSELNEMLKRLTATTKKEHQIEKNAEDILKDNDVLPV